MRFSSTHNFIFLANPKTGSTSLERLLRPFSVRWHVDKHIRALAARDLFYRRRRGEFFDQAYKFCFTRNPWSRIVSLYEYARRQHGLTRAFDDWVYTIRAEPDERGNVTTAVSFHAFAGDEGGRILVDEALKLEEIETRLPKLLEELGIAGFTMRHDNTTDHGPYRDYYDAKSREHVRNLYRADIERFRYEF